MTLDQFPAKVKSKARSTDIVSMGIVSSHKTAEYATLLVSRNTYPVIMHTKQCCVGALICPYSDLYIASIRAIFDRITDEVAHYLLYASRVDCDNNVLLGCFSVSYTHLTLPTILRV